MTFWFDCDGCESFACVNEIDHVTNIGAKMDINYWYLRHFQRSCEHCKAVNEFENVVSRGKERVRIRCSGCYKTQPFFKGLPFDGLRADPHDWFLTLLFFCRGFQQQNICFLTNLCDLTVRTIVSEVLKLISAHNFQAFCDREENPMEEIQADETALCGRRKYERGAQRRKDGTVWVAGFISTTRRTKTG